MTSLTGPITLSQVAKLQNNPAFKGVIQNIIRESKVLDYMSFENVDSLEVQAVRWIKLPEVDFRQINAGYQQVSGDVDQVYESLYAFGADMRMDRVYDKLGNYIKDPRQQNIEMITKSAAFKFKNQLINGDHGTTPDGFEGLKKRISNMSTRQYMMIGNTSGNAPYDPKATVSSAINFVDYWEQAHYKANEGDVQMIILNEAMYWGFTRVLRYAGIEYGAMMDITKDQFDRNVVTYKGVPFVDVGWQIDMATEVITNTEPVGTSNTGTSVYFVPLNMEQGITGIQLDNLEVYDPLNGGEMESLPSKLMRLEWWCGIAGFGSYGPTRLAGIQDPAAW
jgi:hypothetical protein